MIERFDSLVSATVNDSKLATYDDHLGETLFLAYNEFGPFKVIRAEHFGSAWEIMVDEMPTIEPSELPEAYGMYILESENALGNFGLYSDLDNGDGTREVNEYNVTHTLLNRYPTRESAHAAAMSYAESKELDLIEGYEYQSNSSGTGIVDVGHYIGMVELTQDVAESYGIKLKIKRDE